MPTTQTKAIYVEYEIPPLRAIYQQWYADDGQADDEVRTVIADEHPRWKIRKIDRRILVDQGEE